MANIIEHLKKILSARKGEEVRSSIHDSIKAMNDQIENDLGGMIEDGNEVIEAMQEEIQSVETMKENGELNMKPEDLTEAQWANLKSDSTNYYKRYESVYTTTQENEINIPINISQYNTLSILEVYIEGRMLNREEYTINGTNSITLNIPLSEIGTKVHFIVYRSVCASNEDLNELKGPKGDSGAIVFNTIAEMKEDEDLVAGDTCQLLTNEGDVELYKIINNNLSEYVDNYNYVEIVENELYAVRIEQKRDKEKLFGMKINSTRVFRKLFETGFNILNPSGNYYSNNQGFCMVDENTAVLALIEGSKNYTNNNTRIIAVNINTGEILKDMIDEFGHANDLSYNPDTNEIYVGGCSTYDAQGVLTESNKLKIIDYNTFTIKGTYQMPNTIAGICYDRKTKKLWANNHIAVFELDMANYSIVRTINLRGYSYYSGSVGQTVKVFNNIIYRVTAFPNELNIFDINGNFINRFVFNDFMDDSFYIGELETIDMIDDYMYFNGQVRSFDFCPLCMIQIGKTSLKYNISNNNKALNPKPYGYITLNVNNSIDIPNPDGSNNKPFKELVEAISFLNSPVGSKLEAHIQLASTNIEYKGCLINASNITTIGCNSQTIGSLKIEGISHFIIDRCFYKGTIANQPNLSIISCTGVKLYRPNFINNNTGSVYALQINDSEITIGSADSAINTDTTDNLLINIPNNGVLLTKQYKANNIIVNGTAAIVKEMVIFEGTLNTDQQVANYTCNIGSNNIIDQIARYRYIVFEFTTANVIKRIKVRTNGVEYRISEMRSNNSTTAAWLRFYSYMIKFTAQNVMVEYGKQITQNLDENTKEIVTSSMEGYISRISLTDF